MAGTGNPEIDREVQGIQEHLQQALSIASEIGELSGEAQNKDGLVRAVVSANGMLSALEINPRAMKLGSAALAEEIMSTVVAAQEALATRTQELMEPLMGDTSRLRQLTSGSALQDLSDTLAQGPAAVDRSEDPVQETVRQFERIRQMMDMRGPEGR